MVRMTIELTEASAALVTQRMADLGYADASEYFEAMIECDHAEDYKLTALRAALQEGIDSGVSEDTIEDIIAEYDAHRAAA